MKRRLVCGAVTLTLGLLGFAGLGASQASAFSNTYCGVLIYSGTWCGDGSNHSYYYNSATYSGGGSVFICERLLIADTATERSGSSCGYSYVSRNYGPYGWLTEAEVTHYYSGNARHTITGYAVA
jgi:hypothetical protein